MSEGGVYLCAWRQDGDEFLLSLLANPLITVKGKRINRLTEEVAERVVEWSGDGEAVIELIPPISGKLKEGIQAYVSLRYNESVSLEGERQQLFHGGICPKCQHGIGGRTEGPLSIESSPDSAIAGIDGVLPRLTIYSRHLIDALPGDALQPLVFRPVLHGGKQTEYLELVESPALSQIGLVGATYPSTFLQSWRCTRCGMTDFSVNTDKFGFDVAFVSSDDMRGRLPQVFVINKGGRNELALRNDVWSAVAKSGAARGVVTSPVVLLDEPFAERSPTLPTPDAAEFDWIL